MATQFWIKLTQAQKQAWLLAEEGSYEDSGRSNDHIYRRIKSSWKTTTYVEPGYMDDFVRSFVTCTFADQDPKLWKAVAPKLVEACEALGRSDLIPEIRKAQAENNWAA